MKMNVSQNARQRLRKVLQDPSSARRRHSPSTPSENNVNIKIKHHGKQLDNIIAALRGFATPRKSSPAPKDIITSVPFDQTPLNMADQHEVTRIGRTRA